MFTHIGMLTLKDGSTDADRQSIVDGLADLVGVIDGLESVQAGFDLGLREDNASLIFLLSFDSQASWQAYQEAEEHKAIIRERIAPVLASKAFVQVPGLIARAGA
jgi:Stress responsive A/B Barrel Domain